MGAALKFIVDGDSTPFEANMKRTERVIQQAAQNAFVFQQNIAKKSALDPEKSRQADIEEASRSIKARALMRQRAAREAAKLEAEELRKGLLLEQELRDKAIVIEAQREEASRNIRARALRRKRAKERDERLQAMMQGPDLDGKMRNKAMMTPGGGSFNSGFGGSASAMIVSVMRDTAASLASGANPLTVFLQQAPQVLQAMTMMKAGMFDLIKTMLQIPIGPWGSFAGILAGIAAGAAVAYYHVKALVDQLAGVKFSDFRPEYIANHLKRVNAVAEAWKDVSKAVKEAKDDYNSVTKASERAAEASKKHFQHLRAMNEASMLSPRSKAERGLQIDEQERAAELAAKQKEAVELEASSRQKMAQASPILQNTSSKAETEQVLAMQKKRLSDMEAAAAAIEQDRATPGAGYKTFRAWNKTTQELNPGGYFVRAISGGQQVTNKDLDKAADQVLADRAKQRKLVENLTNEAHDKDVLLQQAEKLKTDATAELTRAATLREQLKTDPSKNAQAAADARAEMQQKLLRQGGPAQLTERERIGASINSPVNRIQDQQLQQQKKTAENTSKLYEFFKQRDALGNRNAVYFD